MQPRSAEASAWRISEANTQLAGTSFIAFFIGSSWHPLQHATMFSYRLSQQQVRRPTAHMRKHAHHHICTRTHARRVHTVHASMYAHTLVSRVQGTRLSAIVISNVCMHIACISIFTYVHTYLFACLSTHAYAVYLYACPCHVSTAHLQHIHTMSMHVYTHVYTHVHTHVYMHAWQDPASEHGGGGRSTSEVSAIIKHQE